MPDDPNGKKAPPRELSERLKNLLAEIQSLVHERFSSRQSVSSTHVAIMAD